MPLYARRFWLKQKVTATPRASSRTEVAAERFGLIGFVLYFARLLCRFPSAPPFLRLQESLHRPIELSVHSVFVSKDSVHISFR